MRRRSGGGDEEDDVNENGRDVRALVKATERIGVEGSTARRRGEGIRDCNQRESTSNKRSNRHPFTTASSPSATDSSSCKAKGKLRLVVEIVRERSSVDRHTPRSRHQSNSPSDIEMTQDLSSEEEPSRQRSLSTRKRRTRAAHEDSEVEFVSHTQKKQRRSQISSDEEYVPSTGRGRSQSDEDNSNDDDDDYDDDDDTSNAPSTSRNSCLSDRTSASLSSAWSFMSKPASKTAPSSPSAAKKKQKQKSKASVTSASLPPMSKLSDIFADIIERQASVKELAKVLQDRPLRTATMCSGTEAPLLALVLLSRAAQQQHGLTMPIEHVFSCEIEPFKQAYIERNFAPPILFRDVCELGDEDATQAHTAYGSLVNIPGDIDLLVAGTSCVDYSALNTSRKDIDEGGESGKTFYGMLGYVKRYRPLLVLLENIKGAPWEQVAEKFRQLDYSVEWSHFDTKDYYIPHTRQRGYLLAIRSAMAKDTGRWLTFAKKLERPASSKIDAFLLPEDRSRQAIARVVQHRNKSNLADKKSAWAKCHARHERARDEEELGTMRPFTNWDEGGSSDLSHGAWQEWAAHHSERVLDLLDITHLRAAVKGEDPHYKMQMWELSQNVDRRLMSGKPGTSACLVPKGIPYLTYRGGPLLGVEALSLQGLPIEELSLTRETNDQLQDLAGNAMSSTVVGCLELAALIAALPLLKLRRLRGEAGGVTKQQAAQQHVYEIHDALVMDRYDLCTAQQQPSFDSILSLARLSSQRCKCEGQSAVVDRPLYRCASCQHVSCAACKGRPEHDYVVQATLERIQPSIFIEALTKHMPMRFIFTGRPELELLVRLTGQLDCDFVDAGLQGKWLQRAAQVLQGSSEFRYSRLPRKQRWIAQYDGKDARMECHLDHDNPVWYLYVDPERSEAAGSALRRLFGQPVARMLVGKDGHEGETAHRSPLLYGKWQLNVPLHSKLRVRLTRQGERVPTWEASLGLGGAFKDTTRFNRLLIEAVQPTQQANHETLLDVSGTYDLLDRCGTANGTLFRRQQKGDPLFLFLDPDPYGAAPNDSFVFSFDGERHDSPGQRRVVARAPEGWRWPCKAGAGAQMTSSVTLTVENGWAAWDGVALQTPNELNVVNGELQRSQDVTTSCSTSTSLFSCQWTPSSMDDGYQKFLGLDYKTSSEWVDVDAVKHGAQFFSPLAWLTSRARLHAQLGEWTKVETSAAEDCACTPAKPAIQWMAKRGHEFVPKENEQEASMHERALKLRLKPFNVQFRVTDSTAGMRIAFTPITMAHRALALLPISEHHAADDVRLAWRLTCTERAAPDASAAGNDPFLLRSNRQDPEAETPRGFKFDLRKEQRRSLHWMLQRERKDVDVFQEEEVTEEWLNALGWRLEGRATRNVRRRGGVLADAVGYGKTCITLALIAASKQTRSPSPKKLGGADSKDYIKAPATLIVVPPQLCKQWSEEVHKFCGDELRVCVVYDVAGLHKLTIAELLSADVVIVSVTLYKTNKYFECLSRLAASNSMPTTAGRFFDAMLECALRGLRNRVRELQTQGASKVLESVMAQVDFDESQYTSYVQSSRRAQGSDAAAEAQAPKRNAVRELKGDVSGLKKSSAQQDWRQLKGMPLEAFHWHRVVVDEFHYVAEQADRSLAAIRALRADATWILSGTPPTSDFADVKAISEFFDVHLGIDDDKDTLRTQVSKRRRKARSLAESFRHYVEDHSDEWHVRRRRVAQSFLDHFVRRNVAEIDDVPSTTVVVPISMPAAERACYLELSHMIESLDLQKARKLFRSTKTIKAKLKAEETEDEMLVLKGDREARLQRAFGESDGIEEALVCQASYFVVSSSARKADSAVDACRLVVTEREAERRMCLAQFESVLRKTVEQHFVVLLQRRFRDESNQALVTFVRNTTRGAWGDAECKPVVLAALQQAGCSEEQLTVQAGRKIHPHYAKYRPDAEKDWAEEKKLREMVHLLTQLRNELWSRAKSLRYFRMVRAVQEAFVDSGKVTTAQAEQLDVKCASSKCDLDGERLTMEQLAIATTCGHVGCYDCMLRDAYVGRCSTEGCCAPIKPISVVMASALNDGSMGKPAPFGIKLDEVAQTIEKQIPVDERILLFVQYEGLLQKVSQALTHYGIPHERLSGGAHGRSSRLQAFQEGKHRILLLDIADESAAGSNLTIANHVMFLSALIADDAQSYQATMEQARGRAVRYGQTRKVTVWHFLVRGTIDEQVYVQRGGGSLEQRVVI